MGLLITKQVAAATVPDSPTGTYTIFLDTDGIEKKKDENGVVTPTSASDQNDKVKASATDTTEGFLDTKITGTTDKITITKINSGANESFVVTVGVDVFDKVSDDSDNISEGSVNLFLTSAERTKISNALVSGDNVSELVNDAGYITASSLPPSFAVNLDSAESSVTRVVAGGRTTFTVTHNLGTLDLKPVVFRLSDGRNIGWRVERTGVNTVDVSRNGNIANSLFRLVI